MGKPKRPSETDSFLSSEQFGEDYSPWLMGPKGLWATCGNSSPDGSLRIHSHGRIEFGIVLAGLHEIHFASHVTKCRPGDAWLCAAWEPHGFRSMVHNTRVVVLRFMTDFIGEELIGPISWLTLFAVPPDRRARVADDETRRSVIMAGQFMCREISRRPLHWEEAVRFELLCVLVQLSREWWTSHAARGPAPSVSADRLAQIMPALSLVNAAPWRDVRVPEAAAACGLSLPGFHRIFRQTVGMTFGRFRQQARLSLAAHLLLNTNRTVATVAAEVGFVDDSHLRRRFRAEYKCTPSQYRHRSQSPSSERG
jgi:AraC-like DNA-binding protein